MSFSIGQMNSFLKKYTDTLLALHGIPVNGEFDTDFEKFAEHTTARKSLETALWKLTEENEGLREQVKKLEHDAVYEATEGVRELSRKIYQECQQEHEKVIEDLTKKNEELETQFITEQHRRSDNHFKAVRLATTVKALRDHIADCRGDADERAERYEAILEKADEALKQEFPLPGGKFCRPKKFKDYSPYNTEEEVSDEENDEETDEE